MNCDRNDEIIPKVSDDQYSLFAPSWKGVDVLCIFVTAYLILGLLAPIIVHLFNREIRETKTPSESVKIDSNSQDEKDSQEPILKKTTEHPLSQLIKQGRQRPIILFVAFLSGVILAPLTEEFLFRLVLQGWLTEAVGRIYDLPRSNALPGVLSIIFVSIFFASMHAGTRTEQNVDTLFTALAGLAIANFLIFFFGVFYLRLFCNTSLRNFGFDWSRLPFDFGLALLLFLATTPFILGLNYCLRILFPESVVDPIPLFFLALILGGLFHKTGRIQACIILHAMFNGFSFLVLAFAPFE